ncbi:hypothetical protein ACHAWU_008537 [Discostella pseudostelligera]|uniref:ATP-dependent DNA helicase n=1 Tax=Discostella pseudostelligera TaxID=259834 RepID=A0ABD3M3Q9_9STRA
MNGEWLSSNNNPPPPSRKRDRRSYDNDWSTYEARSSSSSNFVVGGGGGGGGLDRFANNSNNNKFSSSSSSSSARQVSRCPMDMNNITAQGERVGIPHQQQQQQQQQYQNSYLRQPQQQQQHQQQANSNSSGTSSRIRVADYRGAAARVGALPANNGPAPSIHQSDPSYQGDGFGRRGNNSNDNNINGVSLFQNPNFLKSLADPPPITVTLPPALRSTLNDEQCKVVESILSGYSTFFTGPAGSGKSHVLSTLLKANEEGIGNAMNNGKPRKIIVTATTGVAACNVGGVTIHSFAGVGAGNASAAEIAKRVMGNEYTKGRWRDVDVLVIDEISMLAGSFLDKLSFVASRARNDRRPFGGVQLVVCGDFFQLPPVELGKDGFAFEAKCWSEVITCSVLLKQVFRQQGDVTLMNILDEARVGELSAQSAEILRRHGTLPAAALGSARTFGDKKEKIIPTLLECRNREVDKANELEMHKLPGEIHSYKSRDKAINETMKAQLKHCQAPPQLDLKVGAQVMLLKNIDLEKGLANGSRGVIVGFQRPKNESDVPTGFKKMDLPVVKFDSMKAVGKEGDGDSTEGNNEFTIHPEEWANKIGDQTVSSRVQIPLRLAWSISVHKSQGMTIPNLAVNLSGVFEYGQAYVALSRATDLERLTLRGFSEKCFRAHPKVKAFYNLLDNGGASKITNKENVYGHYSEVEQTQYNPYNSSSANPYSQRKQIVTPYPPNPYNQSNRQMQYSVPINERTSPVPHTASLSSSTSSATTLTPEQIKRIEENRQRALAIRLNKQSQYMP